MYTVVMMMAMSGSADMQAIGRCSSRCSGWSCSSRHGCHRSWGCHRRSRCHGCHGCNGCSASVHHGCHGCHNGGPVRTGGAVEVVPAPRRDQEEASAGRSATIVVSLPEDARLTIDGQTTMSTSGERYFTTPPLEPGSTYFYTLKMTTNRNGQPLTQSRQVVVRAGEESRVSFTTDLRPVVGEEAEINNNNNNRPLPPPNR